MRVRFAPSPTGALHIGGARTALYNWLLARGAGGTLVLRIEDTDRARSTPENVAHILEALQWLGIDYDEGPISQVARSDRHQEVLQLLLDSGRAYRSTATGDDVKAFKAQHGADRGFRGEEEGEGAVRLRVPDEGATVVHDVIRGDTTFQHVHLDDPVIARADSSVLYNFAVAVDDLDAGITHVVRGEDHLSNTPKQLLVVEAADARSASAPTPLSRSTRTCRCCTGPTARSSPSATARPPCRSCATPATCPRRCATTSRCSAGATPTTRRSSPPSSSSSASASSGSPRTRPSSTSASCAGSTAATCASCPSRT